MAALILPSRRVVQPQESVEIDWGNPAADGLEVLFHPGNLTRDLARSKPLTVSGKTRIVNGRGVGVGFSGGVGACRFADNSDLVYGPAVSVVWAASTAAGVRTIVGSRKPTTGQLRVFLYTDATGAVTAEGSTSEPSILAYRAKTSSGFVDGKPHTFAFVKRNASTHEFYRDGVLFGSTTITSGDLVNNASTVFEIGGINTGIPSYDHIEAINLVAVYPRTAIAASVALEATKNPWQIFKPQAARLWSVAAVGGPTAYSLTADGAAITLAGTAATLTTAQTLSAASAAITLAGQDATLTHTAGAVNYSLTADSAAITLAGQAANLQLARTLAADSAAITLAGQSATLTHITAGSTAYTLTADSAAITLTGQAATLRTAQRLAAESAAFDLAAQDAVLRKGMVMPAASGDMSIAGQDAILTTTRRLAADSAAIVLAGQDATIRWSQDVAAVGIPAGTVTFALNTDSYSFTPSTDVYSFVPSSDTYQFGPTS